MEAPSTAPETGPAIAVTDTPAVSRSPLAAWQTYSAAIARQVIPRLNESIAGLKESGRRAIEALPDVPNVGRPSGVQWLAAVLTLCVLGQGLAIVRLLNRRAVPAVPAVVVETAIPGADVFVDGRSAGNTPLQLTIGSDMRFDPCRRCTAASPDGGDSSARGGTRSITKTGRPQT